MELIAAGDTGGGGGSMIGGRKSILFVSETEVAIARLHGDRVAELKVHVRDYGIDMIEAVQEALYADAAPLGKTWVISTEPWSQIVPVQADVMDRVTARQVARYMSFEVEPLSGINAAESRAAAVSLERRSGEQMVWVTQTHRHQYGHVEELITRNRGKLAGYLHPAGLPQPLSATADIGSDWRRLEVWPDVVFGVSGDREAARREVFPLPPGDWEGSDAVRWLEESQAAQAPLEIFLGAETPPIDWNRFAPSRVFHANSAADLGPWLEGWAKVLRKPASLPIITADRPPMTLRTQRYLAAGATGALLMACVGHFNYVKWSNTETTARLKQEIEQLTLPAKTATTLRKDTKKLGTEIQDLATQCEKLSAGLETFNGQVESHKSRMPELLSALSAASSEGLLIREIENDGNRLLVTGCGLRTEDVNQLVQGVGAAVMPLGLHVRMPKKEAKYRLPTGGPHDFELVIEVSK